MYDKSGKPYGRCVLSCSGAPAQTAQPTIALPNLPRADASCRLRRARCGVDSAEEYIESGVKLAHCSGGQVSLGRNASGCPAASESAPASYWLRHGEGLTATAESGASSATLSSSARFGCAASFRHLSRALLCHRCGCMQFHRSRADASFAATGSARRCADCHAAQTNDHTCRARAPGSLCSRHIHRGMHSRTRSACNCKCMPW
jgi:hypothetical protein